jgi:beta-galactosidase
MAHNPPSLAMLETCDRLGVIVMEEAFDMWRKGKNDYDYHLFFNDWCLRDISYMVLRDRNHPCVFSYSIGNEIPECNGLSDAKKISNMLADEVRRFDDTRPVTSGEWKGLSMQGYESCDPPEYVNHFKSKFVNGTSQEWVDSIDKVLEEYESSLDMVGCNYYYRFFENEHERYPNRVIWGSENKAICFYDTWEKVKKYNYVLGDFTWTAFDNMGEVGGGAGAIAAGVIFICTDNVIAGIAMIGAGLVLAGLSIFFFFGCKAATKGIIILTQKIARGIKNCFIKKEEA